MNYHGNLSGILEDMKASFDWIPRVTEGMKSFISGVGKAFDVSADMARTLTESYVSLQIAGTISRLEFTKSPEISFWLRTGTFGVPTPATLNAFSEIAADTGIKMEFVIAWANSFYYWYRRGVIPFSVYDPVKDKQRIPSVPGVGRGLSESSLEQTLKAATGLALVIGGLYIVTSATPVIKKLIPAK